MNVCIIAALSADGFIGTNDTHNSTTWTTKADLQFFVRKTKEIGTVIMGRKTFETFGKPLKDRRLLVLTRSPQEIAVDGVEATAKTPVELLAQLEKEGIKSVAICGGASIYAQFMEGGLVDELFLTVMPKLFGKGVPLFDTALDINLALQDTQKLDDNTVLLHYAVVK